MMGIVFTSRWTGTLVRARDANPRRSNGVLAFSRNAMLLPGLVARLRTAAGSEPTRVL